MSRIETILSIHRAKYNVHTLSINVWVKIVGDVYQVCIVSWRPIDYPEKHHNVYIFTFGI